MFHNVPTGPICHVCGHEIHELDPDDIHDDHRRDCPTHNDSDTSCDCTLQAHAYCCETCQREDWPNVSTWLIYRMTADNPPLEDAILRIAIVMMTAGKRKNDPTTIQTLWVRAARESGYSAEVEDEINRLGGTVDDIDWAELLASWSNQSKKRDSQGRILLSVPSATLDSTIPKITINRDSTTLQIVIDL